MYGSQAAVCGLNVHFEMAAVQAMGPGVMGGNVQVSSSFCCT
jgi:hypothetical protein